MTFAEKLKQSRHDLDQMKAYLDLCRRNEDWHGVQDAASDIRELVVEIDTLGWAEDQAHKASGEVRSIQGSNRWHSRERDGHCWEDSQQGKSG
jgi:hypothetical protein